MVEGKAVRLEAEPGHGDRDKYNRLLRYVYLADGRLLNAEIIAQGYGHAYTRFPFSKMEEFRQLERDARENGRGLWGDTQAKTAAPAPASAETEVYATRTGTKYHAAGCRYLAKSKISLKLGEAAQRYQPCSVCSPPERAATHPIGPGAGTTSTPKTPAGSDHAAQAVYVTRTGSKYHRGGCRYLSKSKIPISLKDARARYGPCSDCRPPTGR